MVFFICFYQLIRLFSQLLRFYKTQKPIFIIDIAQCDYGTLCEIIPVNKELKKL